MNIDSGILTSMPFFLRLHFAVLLIIFCERGGGLAPGYKRLSFLLTGLQGKRSLSAG
ncbi:MAG: hypothetical protein WBM43_09445 [Flavobacteriaceae bacterium]